ncbi:cysteine proteinase inhibitor 1-like [Malania oleifera]|uniref:cysteine proteinase inhibitor 1-like n=1 Tax=Malania oleifera TaxID=397392 RepID=UPI0025AE7CF9|nr:cysteine proteinase inhibitor 1-like [Malania oleifera]
MKPQCVVLLLILQALVPFLLSGGASAIPGGWSPIVNVNDEHVKEIANFAVTEHNQEAKDGLKFDKVVKGETQVVAGTNYWLVITATNGSASDNYAACVWEQPWLKSKKLSLWKRIGAQAAENSCRA